MDKFQKDTNTFRHISKHNSHIVVAAEISIVRVRVSCRVINNEYVLMFKFTAHSIATYAKLRYRTNTYKYLK